MSFKERLLEALPAYPPAIEGESRMPESDYKIFEAGYHCCIYEIIKIL